jgi:hypothetical protein
MHINQEQWKLSTDDELLKRRYARLWHRKNPPRRSPKLIHLLQPPYGFAAALGDAIGWIATAIAIRIAVNVLLTSSVDFWIPGIMILTAPAGIALVLVMLAPRWGWVLGYRLLLVMFGLLIGGRL